MKVLIFVLALGTVSAFDSGPYLPSGWRPKGPAFLLPLEARKPASEPRNLETQPPSVPATEEPEKVDVTTHLEGQDLIPGSEASGSDFLREYGPPKGFDSKSITEQALPELDTERPFATTKISAVEVRVPLKDETKVKDETENTIEAKVTQDSASAAVERESEKSKIQEVNTEALVTEKKQKATIKKTELMSAEEVTTKSSIEETESHEVESNLIGKSGKDSQVNDVTNLNYLPPAVNEVENTSGNAQVLLKSGNSGQVDDASSLKYLPPTEEDGGERIENATPLYQANLRNESQVNPGANVEKFPPINKPYQSLSNDKKEIVSNKIENEMQIMDHAVVIEAKTVIEEGSGLESISKEEKPVGFREYGPPRASDAENNL